MVIMVSKELWNKLKLETTRKASDDPKENVGKLLEFPAPAPTWRFWA